MMYSDVMHLASVLYPTTYCTGLVGQGGDLTYTKFKNPTPGRLFTGMWGSLEPPLLESKNFIQRPGIHFKCPTIVSGPLASLTLRTIAVQMSLVAAMQLLTNYFANNDYTPTL